MYASPPPPPPSQPQRTGPAQQCLSLKKGLAFSPAGAPFPAPAEKFMHEREQKSRIMKKWELLKKELNSKKGVFKQFQHSDRVLKVNKMEDQMSRHIFLQEISCPDKSLYLSDLKKHQQQVHDNLSTIGEEVHLEILSNENLTTSKKEAPQQYSIKPQFEYLTPKVEHRKLKANLTSQKLHDSITPGEVNIICENEANLQIKDLSHMQAMATPDATGAKEKRRSGHLDPMDCEYVTLLGCYFGKMVFDENYVIFECLGKPRPNHAQYAYGSIKENLILKKKKKHFLITQLISVQARRFNFSEIALEIYTSKYKTYFFNFYSHKQRDEVIQLFASYKQNKIEVVLNRKESLLHSKYTQMWQDGDMSNFDYLMALNRYSGRTFSDTNQYPIFPWILVNYASQELDLRDPTNFRDLRLPVGALNHNKLNQCLERYHNLLEDGQEPYLYGSHYSTQSQVLYYLVRLQPYAYLAQDLQGGKFDHPDRYAPHSHPRLGPASRPGRLWLTPRPSRLWLTLFAPPPRRLFSSIELSWELSYANQSDVKELIPEFFYLPDFLGNKNKLDLGLKQDGNHVDDVELPKWARSNEEFIIKHRAALESDYVSENLHAWIDLIWGKYQKDISAYNVFYYLTYEDQVEKCLSEEMSEEARRATMTQITFFGQVPTQLFKDLHVQKKYRIHKQFSLEPGAYAESTAKNRYFGEIDKKNLLMFRPIGSYFYFFTVSPRSADTGSGLVYQFWRQKCANSYIFFSSKKQAQILNIQLTKYDINQNFAFYNQKLYVVCGFSDKSFRIYKQNQELEKVYFHMVTPPPRPQSPRVATLAPRQPPDNALTSFACNSAHRNTSRWWRLRRNSTSLCAHPRTTESPFGESSTTRTRRSR